MELCSRLQARLAESQSLCAVTQWERTRVLWYSKASWMESVGLFGREPLR